MVHRDALFEHGIFFQSCAQSVAALVRATIEFTGTTSVEWIIVNDDSRVSADRLNSLLPELLQPFVRIISDGLAKGFATRVNEGAVANSGRWLLPLACDDEIEADAVRVLSHYAVAFPSVRYIASAMADIDESGGVLRFCRHESDPTRLFAEGKAGGGLVAIRRDLFWQLGGYREAFLGCQDYDFALTAALQEPLLVIPEFLYRHRRLSGAEVAGRQGAQDRNTVFALRAFLQRFAAAIGARVEPPRCVRRPPVGIGHRIIRTQGKRTDLLAETLESLSWQTTPVSPIVVVHGDEAARESTRAELRARGFAPFILGAPRLDLRRGHPINVALDHLRYSAPREDYFFFLDDDDIVYPFFAERLTRALNLVDADVAVATATAASHGRRRLPAISF